MNDRFNFMTRTCEFNLEEGGVKHRISTKGPGNWSNKSLFMHLI